MMHLACIADGPYLRHSAAMLHSALSNTVGIAVAVRLLHTTPIDPDDRARLLQMVEGLGGSLRFEPIAAEHLAAFPGGYFPQAVWLRVLLPELMPETDRVLYLDSDLIVTDSLLPLWQEPLGSSLVAAVTNPFYPFMPDHPREQLDLEPTAYFNSGVLLMNLAAMRAEGTTDRLADFARRRPAAPYPDQDALNDVCRNRWRHLHPRWNVQSTLFELSPQQLPLAAAEVAEALAKPAVVHFIGPFKPWHYLCRHPYQAVYQAHAAQTPWGLAPLEGRSARNALLRRLPIAWIDRWFRAERRLKRSLTRLGLAPRKTTA